jgi:hypothetical protein
VGLVTVVEEWASGPDRFPEMLKAEARAMSGHALRGLRDFYKAEEDGGSWGLSATVARFTDSSCMG